MRKLIIALALIIILLGLIILILYLFPEYVLPLGE